MNFVHTRLICSIYVLLLFLTLPTVAAVSTKIPERSRNMPIDTTLRKETISALIDKFGKGIEDRAGKGVSQVAIRWRKSDGSNKAFKQFCLEQFLSDPDDLNKLFSTFQVNLEALYGNLHRVSRRFDWNMQVESGRVAPVDPLFSNYNPFAHVSEDLFHTKIAFAALLNFRLYSLEEKNRQGLRWERQKWAETRLVEQFQSRIPAEVAQKRSEAYTAADTYINDYNIFMNRLLDEGGKSLFPKGLKLISHWGLRDELKAQYANRNGFPQQKMIEEVMKRIIHQEIPLAVINSADYDWNPFTNEVFQSGTSTKVQTTAEPDTRYRQILNIFRAEQLLDPYYPQSPSLMDRRFQLDREIPENEVETILKTVLRAPVLKKIARLIEERLNRPLEPFDIWYNGLKTQPALNEKELDKIVSERYPTVQAFQNDLPNILQKLGFTPQKADFLQKHIQVDPSRGAGHASGAMMRDDRAHLRTRIPPGGMNYKGFNIAIHELGHNVEQVFSLNEMDYYTLNGVPNTAFTEAFAFVFQHRDLEILGVNKPARPANDWRTLADMWSVFEISGVALTDMHIWRWLYLHPDASAGQLKAAVQRIAREIWNKYFAPVLGKKDSDLLAIYSHIVDSGMYTPDYPLGYLISFQIEQYLKQHELATEMERMCRLGRLSPQVWMQRAVGQKVSPRPLIEATERVIKKM